MMNLLLPTLRVVRKNMNDGKSLFDEVQLVNEVGGVEIRNDIGPA